MSNKANVKIDLTRINKGLSEEQISKGREAYARQFIVSANEFVPFKSGALRNSVFVEKSGSRIRVVYLRPYALSVFRGRKRRKWTTGGTGTRWDEKAVEKDGKKMDDAFIRGARWNK